MRRSTSSCSLLPPSDDDGRGSSGDIDPTISTIWRFNGTAFVEFQAVETAGANAWCAFEIDGQHFLAVANSHDGLLNASSPVNSTVLRYDGRRFVTHQQIPTYMGLDIESFRIDNETYLAIANTESKAEGFSVKSPVLKWSREQARFMPFQLLTTSAATGVTHFAIGDTDFLAVANRYGRTGHRERSPIFRWRPGKGFELFQTVQTKGAYDWEFFTIGSSHFLALANHWDEEAPNRKHPIDIDSVVYIYNGTTYGFVHYQSLATVGAEQWRHFAIGASHYLALAQCVDSGAGGTASPNASEKLYRWAPAKSDDDQAPSSSWWVDPITIKVTHDRRLPYPSSAKRVDLAAQRGECERAQVWAWDTDREHTDVRIEFTDLTAGAAVLSKNHWSWKQQGFVKPAAPPEFYRCIEDIVTGRTVPAGAPPAPLPPPGSDCSKTPWHTCWTGCPYKRQNFSEPKACNGGKTVPAPRRPDGKPDSCNLCSCNKDNTTCSDGGRVDEHTCLSGWYPDPLLEVPASGVPYVPKGFTQPLVLELCIPYGQTAANYSGSLEVLSGAAGGSLFTVPVVMEVFEIDLPRASDTSSFNTIFNFGSNLSSWYPPGTAAETMWNDWYPFLAHFRIPGNDIYGKTPRSLGELKVAADNGAKWMGLINEGISFRAPANGTLPSHYVDELIKRLEPVVAGLSDLGLSNKGGFVYGFVSRPQPTVCHHAGA